MVRGWGKQGVGMWGEAWGPQGGRPRESPGAQGRDMHIGGADREGTAGGEAADNEVGETGRGASISARA